MTNKSAISRVQSADWSKQLGSNPKSGLDLLTPSTLIEATWSNLDLGYCIRKHGIPVVDENVVLQNWHRNLLRFPALVL